MAAPDARKSPAKDVKARKKTLKAPDFSSGNEVITLVSKGGTELKVHKEFACYYSPVLDAAFNGEFRERKTQTYKLQAEAGAVKKLVYWLYTQKLDLEMPKSTTKNFLDIFSQNTNLTAKLWVLGDELIIPMLQDQAIDYLWNIHVEIKYSATRCLVFVYRNTAPNSALRRFFVIWFARNVSAAWFTKYPEHTSKEFLLELIEYKESLGKAAKVKLPPITAEEKKKLYVEEKPLQE